jgi:RNA polymerase sigma-70 factor, ECF subfamily
MPTETDEAELVRRLRARDEAAFREMVERYHGRVIAVARTHVSTRAIAEEVAQDAWLGVLQGIDRFEERSSFSTWLFRIVSNRAKTRGIKERRSVPFASMTMEDGPAVDPDLFDGMMMWRDTPSRWGASPESVATSGETLSFLEQTIETLPENQRAVVTLRDQLGWTSAEVCDSLGISEVNQRVLLHRGRSKLRSALDGHFSSAGGR